MLMKGYSAFPKAPALLEPHHQIVLCYIQDTRLGGGVLPLCRGAVSVFYSPSRLSNIGFWVNVYDPEFQNWSPLLDKIKYQAQNTLFMGSDFSASEYNLHILRLLIGVNATWIKQLKKICQTIDLAIMAHYNTFWIELETYNRIPNQMHWQRFIITVTRVPVHFKRMDPVIIPETAKH